MYTTCNRYLSGQDNVRAETGPFPFCAWAPPIKRALVRRVRRIIPPEVECGTSRENGVVLEALRWNLHLAIDEVVIQYSTFNNRPCLQVCGYP